MPLFSNETMRLHPGVPTSLQRAPYAGTGGYMAGPLCVYDLFHCLLCIDGKQVRSRGNSSDYPALRYPPTGEALWPRTRAVLP